MLLLGDVLCEMLQHEHQDVVVHAAKTVSVIGDAVQKLGNVRKAHVFKSFKYLFVLKSLTRVTHSIKSRDYKMKWIFFK